MILLRLFSLLCLLPCLLDAEIVLAVRADFLAKSPCVDVFIGNNGAVDEKIIISPEQFRVVISGQEFSLARGPVSDTKGRQPRLDYKLLPGQARVFRFNLSVSKDARGKLNVILTEPSNNYFWIIPYESNENRAFSVAFLLSDEPRRSSSRAGEGGYVISEPISLNSLLNVAAE
jgi:hypothetical protein